MQRVKRRIFSGVVCEQEVYTVSDRANIKKAEPRPRFKDDEERAQHRIGISKRKHQRLVNENFSPLSLYSTLTFDDDSEVHTFSEARRIRDNYFRRLQRACPDAKTSSASMSHAAAMCFIISTASARFFCSSAISPFKYDTKISDLRLQSGRTP